jgi:hypothetical protein
MEQGEGGGPWNWKLVLSQSSTRCSRRIGRSRPHQGAGIGGLEESLTDPYDDQTPDDVPQRALRGKLTEQDQPKTGDGQAQRSEDARAETIRQDPLRGAITASVSESGVSNKPAWTAGNPRSSSK